MGRTTRYLWLGALAALLSFAAAAATSEEAIVIKKDGTRLEGQVTERGGTVYVRTKAGRKQVPRAEVKVILKTTSCLDRFKANPTAKDLVILGSRAGMRMPAGMTQPLVDKLKSSTDVLAAAEQLLDRMRLTPKHTREAIDKNREAFKKECGAHATEIESNHYWVLTTTGAAHARKVAARMDGIFREYQRRLVFKEKISEKFVVKVYASRTEYLAHGAPGFSAAYFSPSKRELVGYKQRTEDILFRSLYHEGMHQFLMFYVPNPPIWFNEGLAKYFENAKYMRGARSSSALQYRVGKKDPLLARSAKQAAMQGRLVPLKKLTTMSKAQFYSNPHLNYSQAWALTHFMIEGGNPLLKKLWKDYFFALRDGATGEEANKKTFGKLNPRLLESLFKKYVMRL